MLKSLILPSELPWDKIQGKDLEELLYWLFDAMGAKNLEWRIGGTGSGTSDQGRDLELSIYMSSLDGELAMQKWWVEAKGRSGTVSPIDVKSAVLNAAGYLDVDVLVVATNAAFSNPTRDWVREWQSRNPRPRVKLWERTELEALCSKNPLAVIRLFNEALSPQGKLEVVKAKLWDYASFSDKPILDKIWRDRNVLEIDSRALLALIASEVANGNLDEHSWAMYVNEKVLISAVADGLLNFLYLIFRANAGGTRESVVIATLAYVFLACIERLGADFAAELVTTSWENTEGSVYPEHIRKLILRPVLALLSRQISDVCASDCARIHSELVELSDAQVKSFWRRLIVSDVETDDEKKFLFLEATDQPCNVGFDMTTGVGCPLFRQKELEERVLDTFHVFKKVADYRKHR